MNIFSTRILFTKVSKGFFRWIWNIVKPWPSIITRPVGSCLSGALSMLVALFGVCLFGGPLYGAFFIIKGLYIDRLNQPYALLVAILLFLYITLVYARLIRTWIQKVTVPFSCWLESYPG